MKKYLFSISFIALFAASLFAQKGKKVMVFDLDLQRNGLYYQRNTIDPFDGVAYDMWDEKKKRGEVRFKKGKLHGKSIEWNREGVKVIEANFKDGLKDGEEIQYYSNKKKSSVINYTAGLLNGEYVEWYDNGKLKGKGKYVNDKEVGEHIWYFTSGQKDQLVPYENGVVNGLVKNWHTNGKLKKEAAYISGSKTGKHNEYYDTGKPSITSTYKNGLLNGQEIKYYENGQKSYEGNWADSMRQGKHTWYSMNGEVRERHTHNDDGDVIKVENFRTGRLSLRNGYAHVFNTPGAYTYFLIQGKKVRTIAAAPHAYYIDNKILELRSIHHSELNTNINSLPAQLLKQELDQLSSEYDTTIVAPAVETITNANSKSVMFYSIEIPKAKRISKNGNTITHENLFLATINERVLVLRSPSVSGRGNCSPVESKELLHQVFKTLQVSERPYEINALLKKLNG